MTEKYITH